MRPGALRIHSGGRFLNDSDRGIPPKARLRDLEFAADEMVMALRRALAVHAEQPLWRALQRNGMAADFNAPLDEFKEYME